jgi:predicted lysophospholipase L1 biosynthesis ABC-type transport system permease subunit
MWRSSHPERQRWLALGGLIAPFLLIGAVVVTASARPDYRHDEQMISVLGELGGPRAAVMNYGGFLLYGVLIIGLAVGLHEGIRNGPGDWLGPLLVGVHGLGYVAVAFAPCSPGCTGTSSSPNEQAHFLISRLIFMTAVAGPFVLFTRLAKDPVWSSLRYLVLLLTTVGYLIFLLPLPGLGAGLQQRLFIGCTLGWILVLAWRLFRLTAPRPSFARAAA